MSVKFRGPRTGESKVKVFVQELLSLNVGERLLITLEEWPLKSTPSTTISHQKGNKSFYSNSLKDGSGWVLTRES